MINKDKKIHILTPFYRQELKGIHIKNMLPYSDCIIWHPIEQYNITKWDISLIKWLRPSVMQFHKDDWDWAYEKLNHWITWQLIQDNDYYWFMNDDCWCDAQNFFTDIIKCNTDVIFVSALRGHNKPKGLEGTVQDHDTTPLIADTLNHIGLGKTDLGQIIVKGSILKQIRFPNNPFADGHLAENIKANKHITKTLLPNTYFYFNYYQKGRWNHKIL